MSIMKDSSKYFESTCFTVEREYRNQLIVNTHRSMHRRISSKIELSKEQRVLNLTALKRISHIVYVVMMKSIVNTHHDSLVTHATRNWCLLQARCSNLEMTRVIQNTTRYIFVSVSEETIEIWTYISINK